MTPWLGRGLVGALAGSGISGLLSASGGLREGETKEERTARIIRNTLAGGALAGAGAAILPEALPALDEHRQVGSQREADQHKDQSVKQLGRIAALGTGGAVGGTTGLNEWWTKKQLRAEPTADLENLRKSMGANRPGFMPSQAQATELAGARTSMQQALRDLRARPNALAKGFRSAIIPAAAAYFLAPAMFRGGEIPKELPISLP